MAGDDRPDAREARAHAPPPDADAEALSTLGYAQELLRSMGGLSSFALSFSIISILTGVVTTYDVALTGGGPAALGIGWPLVSVGTIFVALAMAELASAFPTAGAMYHWAAVLGGPGWGWFVAMMNLVGQLAIVAAIDLGCAQQITAACSLPNGAAYGIFVVVAISHGLVNLVSVWLVTRLNDLSVFVHIAGVALLVGLLLLVGRAHPLAYALETGFTTRPGGGYALGFMSSLLLGMWTFTGFDASAHVSEETHDPATRAPWGIVSAVLVSAVSGYALVVAITLAITDLPAAAADPHPAVFIIQRALGGSWASAGRVAVALAIVAMWFCGLSAVTSLSRTLYAFARDGGLPGSAHLRRVSGRRRTPHVAIAVSVALPLALGLASALLDDDQFLAVASLATTALYVSYVIPIALGAVARQRGVWRRLGPWHLGRFGVVVAWTAVAWTAVVLATAALPHRGAYLGLLVAVSVGLVAFYFAVVRGRFKGPADRPKLL
jgi:amino acid transporter